MTRRWRGASRGRRTAVLAGAALLHGLGLLAMWQARVTREGTHALVVETTLLPLRAPVDAPRPPARGRVARIAPAPRPAPLVAPTPIASPSPLAPLAAAAPPASAASEPLPKLQLTLTRGQLRELEASRPKSLAEAASTPSHASPFDRLAGDGEGLAENRLPDGSLEVHVHGGCFRQTQGTAQKLDPIGHAHDVFIGNCSK